MSAKPLTREEELEAENRVWREVFTAMQWAQSAYRFHAFDALRDDTCPACGSPVRLEDNGHGTGVKLRPRFS